MKLKIYLLDCQNIPLDDLFYISIVSLNEKTQYDSYQSDETKREKLASIYLKNKYVGEYHVNENGKPVSDHLFFNVSHSHYLVGLIVDEVPVGIDIEKIRQADEKLKKFVTSQEEKEYIHGNQNFFEIWTNKEALVKCLGIGIKEKPDTIPSLPINGVRKYKGKAYFNKTIKYQDYIITISRQKNEDFEIEIIEESI